MRTWIVLAMLTPLASCNCGDDGNLSDAGSMATGGDAGGVDAGGVDAGGVDAGGSDAGGSDAGTGDAGSGQEDAGSANVVVTLVASVNPVVTEMSMTLSASVTGGTATQVEFIEDGTSRGIDTTAPYAQARSFLFAENGTHQWVAHATVAGMTVASAPLTLTVAIPASGLYVSTSGNDANAGTLAAPLATIQRARVLALAGQTIWLLDGVYNASNQLSWGSIGFSNTVYVRGQDAGAVLEGPSSSGVSVGLAFANGGGLSDVTIRNFATGSSHIPAAPSMCRTSTLRAYRFRLASAVMSWRLPRASP